MPYNDFGGDRNGSSGYGGRSGGGLGRGGGRDDHRGGGSRGGSRGGYGGGARRDGGYGDSDGYSGRNLRDVNWSSYDLIPFEKNFYDPHPNIRDADKRQVEEYRQQKEIYIQKGNNVPNPITNFAEGGFPDYVMDEIKRKQFALSVRPI